VVLLGLTKRWSLYVASSATPGSQRDLTPGGIESKLTGSVRAVASGENFHRQNAPLRATALSLSHLTWSFGTTAI